jgi:signal transduction histidine kinase
MPNPPRLSFPAARLRRWAAAVPYLLVASPVAPAAAALTVLVLPFWVCAVGVGVVCARPGRGAGRRAADPALWLAPLLLLAGATGRAERELTTRLAGLTVDSPHLPRPPGAGDRPPVRGSAVWREVAHVLLVGPVWGVLGPVALLHLLAPPLLLASAPWWYGRSVGRPVHAGLWRFEVPSAGWALTACVAAPLLALPALALLRGLAVARAHTVRSLLGPTEEARRAVEREAARAAAVRAHHADHRRIERDLHDGAQARMVAVSLGLGRARRRFPADPEAARALVDEAYEESRRALADLRAVVRGLHPPVLADRGLDAAVSSLAAASDVPVDVRVELARRAPGPVESAAYFVIAECLANVGKHAGADHVRVRVDGRGDRIVVRVDDDGAGGAVPSRGGGLAGLEDRVRAVGGRLRVHSPAGGPTSVEAELPCGW